MRVVTDACRFAAHPAECHRLARAFAWSECLLRLALQLASPLYGVFQSATRCPHIRSDASQAYKRQKQVNIVLLIRAVPSTGRGPAEAQENNRVFSYLTLVYSVDL